jgi:uncharacterized coiled-coil protein SlyX
MLCMGSRRPYKRLTMDLENRLLQLELNFENAKDDINELRDILIELSWSINDINKKIEKIING